MITEQDQAQLRRYIDGQVTEMFSNRAYNWARDQLNSMPGDSGDRCPIGQAFEDAVMKVVTDHARWDYNNGPMPETGLPTETAAPNLPRTDAEMDQPDDDLYRMIEGMRTEGVVLLFREMVRENTRLSVELRQVTSETMRPSMQADIDRVARGMAQPS